MSAQPRLIDARMPRFNQGALALSLVVGFVFGVWWVIPLWAVFLALGAAFGSRYGPFLRLYAEVVAPRLGPATTLEDPRPPRFAATLGAGFLVLASLALVGGLGAIAWILALIVAALAALASASGLCVGCEVYLWLERARAGGNPLADG